MPTASSYDGALLCVARQRVADLRNQLRTLSAAYASCVPGRDDGRMEELEAKICSLSCLLMAQVELMHRLEAEERWLQVDLDSVPEQLRSQRAMNLWKRLWKAGLVDENLKPTGTWREAALMADRMADLLKLRQRWVFFERLWGMRNLRGDYNKAFGSPSLDRMQRPIIEALEGKLRE